MGGPSYESPHPVKRSDGTTIIWDWGKRDFVPYDPAAGEAAARAMADTGPGTPDSYGERDPGNRSVPAGLPATTPAPNTGARLTLPARRKSGGPQPFGAGSSLLTPRNDR